MNNKLGTRRFAARQTLFMLHCSLFVLFSLFVSSAHSMTEIRDTEIERFLQETVAPLARAADIPTDRLRIRVIRDDRFNAFITGGSDIFIHTGLLTRIDSPAELQAVLAHEIGHVALGHIVQLRAKMRAETTRMLVMQALGVGMAAMYNPQAGAGMVAGATGVAQQSVLAFTREEERAADDFAIRLLNEIETDLTALLTVFQKMQSSAENRINPHNISHPLTEERIRHLRLHLPANPRPQTASNELKMVQAKLIGYLDNADRVRTLFPNSDTSNPALYARAIMRMRSGDLEGAKTGTLTLISRNRNNPFFFELLGDIEFRAGRYDDSVKAYEQALKLTNNAPQINLALAMVLAERRKPGDAERATELAKRAILTEPMPLAWWILARTDENKADYYLAEYHFLRRNIRQAQSHARRAVRTLPRNSPEAIKARDIIDFRERN